jgi:hypothetical protein
VQEQLCFLEAREGKDWSTHLAEMVPPSLVVVERWAVGLPVPPRTETSS